MRILWHSNAPWASTGYGNQTRLFTSRIRDGGHDVAISALWGLEGGILQFDGMPVYPRYRHPYGMDVMGANSQHWQADIVISLIDAWVIEPHMLHMCKWVPWFPVDMEPIPPPVAKSVAQAYKRIVFSKYAEKACADAGLDCYYVPHGYDSKVFAPLVQGEARQTLGWPQDKFIIGMVAANKDFPSRKSWPSALAAFAEFAKERDDVLFYAHTNEQGGVNIRELAETLGIATKIMMPEQYTTNTLGMPDNYMRSMYSSLDVLLNPAMGEGFGVPILEAQACGVPVIVGDWTAMSELCFGGYAIPKHKAERTWTPLGAWQYQPTVKAIEQALGWAYRNARDERVRLKALQGALDYDADIVTKEYWLPTLADIEKRVKLWKAAQNG